MQTRRSSLAESAIAKQRKTLEKSLETLTSLTPGLRKQVQEVIKPGMSLQVTPSTVKREEFGGIEGKVTKISAFPVTQKGAASLIGNRDILPEIMTQGARIAVFTELKTDSSTVSGYKWSSSQGLELKITPGTTSSVRIKVEEKAPITFVLPILKDWTGLG